jgi:hypothetical protein
MVLDLINLLLHERGGIIILLDLLPETFLYLNDLVHDESLGEFILIDNIEVDLSQITLYLVYLPSHFTSVSVHLVYFVFHLEQFLGSYFYWGGHRWRRLDWGTRWPLPFLFWWDVRGVKDLLKAGNESNIANFLSLFWFGWSWVLSCWDATMRWWRHRCVPVITVVHSCE